MQLLTQGVKATGLALILARKAFAQSLYPVLVSLSAKALTL
ncbi:MAG: hypothetical protein WB368_19870 [Candidatus Sulfotelmatobacter sp.]